MAKSYHPESYWDKVAESIATRKGIKIIAGDDEPYYRYKRKRFLELLGKIDFSGKEILEVGSGPGGNLDFINTKGCKKLTGVDIAQQMIALSAQLLKGKDIPVLKMDGKNLPFEDKTFDVVFTSTVLQHITDEQLLQQLCGEICRVSREEVLVFERIENHIKGHQSNMGRPVRYYKQLLHSNGFELISVQSLPIQASYYVCGIIRKVFNRGKRAEGQPLSKLSVALEKIVLPITSLLDKLVASKRDVSLLQFRRIKETHH